MSSTAAVTCSRKGGDSEVVDYKCNHGVLGSTNTGTITNDHNLKFMLQIDLDHILLTQTSGHLIPSISPPAPKVLVVFSVSHLAFYFTHLNRTFLL